MKNIAKKNHLLNLIMHSYARLYVKTEIYELMVKLLFHENIFQHFYLMF